MTRNDAMAYRSKIEAAASTMTDETALTAIDLFPAWAVGKEYVVSGRVRYNGKLYKCAQAHTAQADWTPYAVPALWVAVSVDAWPEWVQPSGAHDAYKRGDKVSYNGKHYICTADANVYAPGVYGWEEST